MLSAYGAALNFHGELSWVIFARASSKGAEKRALGSEHLGAKYKCHDMNRIKGTGKNGNLLDFASDAVEKRAQGKACVRFAWQKGVSGGKRKIPYSVVNVGN